MRSHEALEVAKTVLEVADVAWSAVEFGHHRHEQHDHESVNVDSITKPTLREEKDDVESLKAENRRLRGLLEENLKLLKNLSESPCLVDECPPDVCAVLSGLFLPLCFCSLIDRLCFSIC